MYYLRDKTGYAKAKLSNDLANKIMREARGQFREVNYTDGRKVVFEIQGDFTYGTDEIKILIWEGDRLVPVD